MPQTKQQIQSLLDGAFPRRELGQNFMIDANLVRIIADAGDLAAGDRVIEVGPGTGTLTDELLARGAEVLAVEIDRRLAESLRNRLADQPRFRLIEGDALASKHALHPELLAALGSLGTPSPSSATFGPSWGSAFPDKPVKVIANLPYNIASPLIVEMLLAGVPLIAVTIQKEVAERLRAKPSTENYGALSVIVQLLANVELLRTLPPQAFWPPPKIESALVRLRHRDQLGVKARPFGAFLQKLFSARRKMLRGTLGQWCDDPREVLRTAGIPEEARPEEVEPMTLVKLFEATNLKFEI